MLILGLIQSLFSAGVFWFRQPRHPANRILALWLLIFALLFLGLLLPEGLVAYTKIGFIPFFLLSGPAFYFYVRSLIVAEFRFRYQDGWHALPFALMAVFRLVYLPESISSNTVNASEVKTVIWVVILLIVCSVIIYWIATVVLLLRHQRNMLNFFSSRLEKRSLKWVPLLMLATLFSHVLFFSGAFINNSFPSIQSMNFWTQQFNMAMLGYLLLVFGLIQPIIFEREVGKITLLVDEEPEPEKYQHSGLKPDVMEQLAKKILHYMEAEQPYVNPEYNLQSMMQDLGLPQQNLSQTINEHLGKNFYQLINEYRVREFQRLLQQPEAARFTILSLAYEAGFNSKSSFNRAFKEITGKTPSQYQREVSA